MSRQTASSRLIRPWYNRLLQVRLPVNGSTTGISHGPRPSKTHRKTPGVCGGRLYRRHRVRVQDIVVWHERRGYSPDEIVDMFPGITLADVYARSQV